MVQTTELFPESGSGFPETAQQLALARRQLDDRDRHAGPGQGRRQLRIERRPLVVGHAPPEVVGRILERLWDGPETRIVISSDLSHYLPYEEGRHADARTARRIATMGAQPIGPDEACGASGINGLLWIGRKKQLRGQIIDLRSSGDTAGDKARVVGYGAFAFY